MSMKKYTHCVTAVTVSVARGRKAAAIIACFKTEAKAKAAAAAFRKKGARRVRIEPY